jgi:hypothetical protein
MNIDYDTPLYWPTLITIAIAGFLMLLLVIC